MNQLYLICELDDERGHYNPIGIFDYAHLRKEFEIVQSEEEINLVYRWTQCYNVDDYGAVINGCYKVLPVKENRWIPNP